MGLTGADLQLFHPDRKGARIIASEITCHGDDAEGNFQGKVEGLAPWWILNVAASESERLMGRRLRNDGKDCVCQGFRTGDEIRAVMTARVNDCFVIVAGETFQDLSQAKLRFIEHLIKLDVLKGTEAVLGEQVLKVVEKP